MSSEALREQVMRYGQQLAGDVPLTKVADQVWTARLADGTIINVRSISSSQSSRWTIDLRGPQVNPRFGKYELKFK